MARGTSTTERYEGELGRTRRGQVHLSCACGTLHAVEVVLGVDAATDGELARRLLEADVERRLNVARCPRGGDPVAVDVPVVFHDPGKQVFALVLPESSRHREAAERSRLWSQLAADTTASIPAYVRQAVVVFGAPELRAHLEAVVEGAVAGETLGRELSERERELERVAGELDRRSAALGEREDALRARERQLDRREREPAGATPATGTAQEHTVRMDARGLQELLGADAEISDAGETESGADAALPGQDGGRAVIAEVRDAPELPPAPEQERWVSSGQSVLLQVADGAVRLGVKADDAELEALCVRDVRVRLQLHRMPSYPLISLAIGADDDRVVRFFFDVGDDGHRAVLEALSRDFRFTLDVYSAEPKPVRRRVVGAPLASTVGPLLVAADGARHEIAPDERSFARAVSAIVSPRDDRSRGLDVDRRGDVGETTPVASARRSGPIHSEVDPVASGVIAEGGKPAHLRSEQSLLAELEDRERRVAAAVELADRGGPRSIEAVFRTVVGMTRAESSRVLAGLVGYGREATPYLIEGTRSRKTFIRQGSALALGVLCDEQGVEVLCDMVFEEPTEIWREVARALGEVGRSAIMPLVARLGHQDPDRLDRASWALAHLCARGGTAPVETLARGRDPVAAKVARAALELADRAATDREVVKGPTPREVTVNRAFSRRFFEAMNAPPGILVAERSAPAMELDDTDLLEAADLEDEAEVLDENDFLPG